MAKSNDSKTTWAGAIAGAIVAFGGPIVGLFSQAPAEAIHSISLDKLLIGIGLAVLGKLSAGTKKE